VSIFVHSFIPFHSCITPWHAYLYRRCFLCLANEPLESDPGAAVGGAAQFEAAEETVVTEGKHLCMLSYYFIQL
jgi:hypothetical protein